MAKLIPGVNDLATVNPELAKEWHPTKNGNLKPNMIAAQSNKKVWWTCSNGHEWEAVVCSRSKGNSCPFCAGQRVIVGVNDLATTHPALAKEWHPTKNGNLTVLDVMAKSNKKVWWQCSERHEWQAYIYNRVSGNGCPFCSGRLAIKGVNDLATVNPELAKEWHPTKNGNNTPCDYLPHSKSKVWWLTPYDDPITGEHFDFEWMASISDRTDGKRCPFLRDRRSVLKSKYFKPKKIKPFKPYKPSVLIGFNDLATTYPDLVKEWHPTKNSTLTCYDVTAGSSKKVWWLGECGHEWQASINDRTRGQGCPYCSNHRILVGFNDLATTHPALVREWHSTKNGNLKPNMVFAGSRKTVWWQCSEGHEWQARINHRSNGIGCPYCSGRYAIKGVNDLATTHPELAKEWHPTKNGNLKPETFMAGSGKKVWWLGECGHEWQAVIESRALNGCGCPICNQQFKTSFAEQAIYFYLQQCGVVAENRAIIFGKEIDVYIPSKFIGIEYDGDYYHLDSVHDLEKNAWLSNHGIRLIRIRENGCPPLDIPDVIIRTSHTDGSLNEVINSLLTMIDIDENISIDVGRDRIAIMHMFVHNIKDNSIAVTHPNLLEEWDYDKNGSLSPLMFTAGSGRKVWWRCLKCGHEWQADFYHRTHGRGCPVCAKKKSKEVTLYGKPKA